MGDPKTSSSVPNTEYDYVMKFLALGDSGVGKTTFLYQYTDGKFNPRFSCTAGVDYSEKRFNYKTKASKTDQSYRIHLQLWDTAGQERFRSLTSAFFREAVGFILMFDLTSERSFINVRNWLSELRAHAYCDSPDVILVGNKVDRQDARVVSGARAKELADQFALPYIETSGVTGENVTEAIHVLLDRVIRRMEQTVDKPIVPVRQLPLRPIEKENNCAC